MSDRQREVLRLVAGGYRNREIADRLGITPDGVKWHVTELLNKTGLQSREELAAYWKRHRSGWLRIGRALQVVSRQSLKPIAAGIGTLAVAGAALSIVAMARSAQTEAGPDSSIAALSRQAPAAEPTVQMAPPPPDIALQDVRGVALWYGSPVIGDLPMPLRPDVAAEARLIERLLSQLAAAQPTNELFQDELHIPVSNLVIVRGNGPEVRVAESWTCDAIAGGTQCSRAPGLVDVWIGDGPPRRYSAPELSTWLGAERWRSDMQMAPWQDATEASDRLRGIR